MHFLLSLQKDLSKSAMKTMKASKMVQMLNWHCYTVCGQISTTESSRQPSVMDSGGHLLSNSLWPTKAATLAHQSSCMHDTHIHTDWTMLFLCLLIFYNSHHITVTSGKSIHHFFSSSFTLFLISFLASLTKSTLLLRTKIRLYNNVAKIMHYLA